MLTSRNSRRIVRAAGLGAGLALMLVVVPATGSAATQAPDRQSLKAAVDSALAERGNAVRASAEQRRSPQFKVDRQDQARGWVIGTAVLAAPRKEGAYPLGWIFLARSTGSTWQVALEGSSAFATLAARAPGTVLPAQERTIFSRGAGTLAITSDNTRMRLPYAVGATWTLTGGPHGSGGTNLPYNSIDLAGGDSRVLAAASGTAKMMCGSGRGWIRVYHSNGYASDYYHLRSNINPGAGTAVSEGAFLGYTGTDVSCGGSASGPHVHFSIWNGDASPDSAVSLNSRSIGKWVFWTGTAYNGYATHGSTVRTPGQGLYNYGKLLSNQGIVDTNGGTTLNKRTGPGTGYALAGSVADGATVTVSCWRNGTTHTGRYGTTSVWDKLSDGTWVSDAYLYTGVSTIGPNC